MSAPGVGLGRPLLPSSSWSTYHSGWLFFTVLGSFHLGPCLLMQAVYLLVVGRVPSLVSMFSFSDWNSSSTIWSSLALPVLPARTDLTGFFLSLLQASLLTRQTLFHCVLGVTPGSVKTSWSGTDQTRCPSLCNSKVQSWPSYLLSHCKSGQQAHHLLRKIITCLYNYSLSPVEKPGKEEMWYILLLLLPQLMALHLYVGDI